MKKMRYEVMRLWLLVLDWQDLHAGSASVIRTVNSREMQQGLDVRMRTCPPTYRERDRQREGTEKWLFYHLPNAKNEISTSLRKMPMPSLLHVLILGGPEMQDKIEWFKVRRSQVIFLPPRSSPNTKWLNRSPLTHTFPRDWLPQSRASYNANATWEN